MKRINVILVIICLICVSSTIYMGTVNRKQCDEYADLLNQSEDMKTQYEISLSTRDAEIKRLEQELSIRETIIAELNSELKQNAEETSLFNQYFAEIDWNDLGYDEIYQINKQIAISGNLVELEHISQKSELNDILISLLEENFSKTTDKTLKSVLEFMISDLQEENKFLSAVLKQLMKENLELQGYDEAVIMPIGE